MSNYKVIGFTGTQHSPRIDNHRYAQAADIKDTYGLPNSIEEIISIWESYSDTMAAGWLIHDKESVESAFGVVLEKI